MAEGKKKDLVVTAPLIRMPDPSGRFVYLYHGASVEGWDEKEVQRHVDLGLVGEDKDAVPGVAVHPAA